MTQTDTLSDVFPLAVGNQWTYRYYTFSGRNSSFFEEKVDSGVATFSIVGKIAAADSTRWLFVGQQTFRRHHVINSWDTTYFVRDSLSFEVIEKNESRHRLYRADLPTPSTIDVFPFGRYHTDTTTVNRYARVGIHDTTMFKSRNPNLGWTNSKSLFTFRKGIGLVRYQYDLGVIDLYLQAHHFLISQTLVSVPGVKDKPTEFYLLQNYPNPFNPTTTITYIVGQRSSVSLKVFDVLGREVATLVDEVQGAGFKRVTFDGSGFASGVYFYRLKAAGFVQTKKLMLIR